MTKQMLLELSDYDLEEIQALMEMFDEAYFNVTDKHISVEMSLQEGDSQKLDKKYGVYGCILQMYYDKIDIGAITIEQRTKMIDTLNATKEMFAAMCRSSVSFRTETIDKLLAYFTV